MAKASISKAERLRIADLQADKEEDKIIAEWEQKRARANSKIERQSIDDKYGKLAEKADKKSKKTYKAYYDYIHKSFSKDEITNAMKVAGGFTSKAFLQKLFSSSKAKPTAKKPTKPKTTAKTSKPKAKPTAKKTAPKRK